MKRVSLAIVYLVAPAAPVPADAAQREFSLPQPRTMPGSRTFFDADFRQDCIGLEGLR
jgi:hypothetical protein